MSLAAADKLTRRAMHLFAFQSIRQVSWAREYYDTKKSRAKPTIDIEGLLLKDVSPNYSE